MNRAKYLKSKKSFVVLLICAAGIILVASVTIPYAPARASSPVASAPYSISIFATSVPGQYTQPGAIAFTNQSVYVAYSNGAATDGSSGSTTIVQYSTTGTVGQTYTVPGANAVLKTRPETGLLWALQNPAANPSLTTIDPFAANPANAETQYTFPATANGAGYSDVAFLDGKAFLSETNPSANPNTAPAILSVTVADAPTGNAATVSPVLLGNPTAIDSLTGASVALNLLSPSSLVFDPLQDLVLTDQADSQLVVVHSPNDPDQSVYRTTLSMSSKPVQPGNTVFASSVNGMLLVSDPAAEIVYAINAPAFAPGQAFTIASGTVSKVDLGTGLVTPIVTGLTTPTNVAFIDDSNFRLSFTPNQVTLTGGGAVLAYAEANRQGPITGAITISLAPGASLPKGYKFVTPMPISTTTGATLLEMKVKAGATGRFGIPFTATDASGRIRKATLIVDNSQ